MKNSVTICVGSIGSSTFEKCIKSVNSIAKSDPRVKKVCIIKDKSPQSAWLNEMRYKCQDTKWCLQVDEDMYLYDGALSILMNFAKEKEASGAKILNASSLLYDLFLKRNIGSLKLWSSKALQTQEFRDVLGGDRDYAHRAKKNGFKNVEINKVLGDHDSAPTCDVAYKKYFEYINKIKKFRSDISAKNFTEGLKSKYLKEKSNIAMAAYFGAYDALISPLENRSKGDYFNNNDLYNIFSSSSAEESFSMSYSIVKKRIVNGNMIAANLIVKSLRNRNNFSKIIKFKKAYDGAMKAVEKNKLIKK